MVRINQLFSSDIVAEVGVKVGKSIINLCIPIDPQPVAPGWMMEGWMDRWWVVGGGG